VSDQLHEFDLRDVIVMALGGFCRGREDRIQELIAMLEAGRKRSSTNLFVCLVIFPAGTFQITSNDAFDGQDIGLSYQHRPAAEHLVSTDYLWHFLEICRIAIILNNVFQLIELKLVKLCEKLYFMILRSSLQYDDNI